MKIKYTSTKCPKCFRHIRLPLAKKLRANAKNIRLSCKDKDACDRARYKAENYGSGYGGSDPDNYCGGY